jgi:polyphosphate kinase 2 (PPK2 family)
MASHTTGNAPSESQNQDPPADVKDLQLGQAEDENEPKSQLSAELESSNKALQLKLQALQRELEQTKAEISAVDHVLEVAGKSS